MTESHLNSELKLSIGQKSLAGVKQINEDAIGIRIPEKSLLTTKGVVAVIADGVSAAEAGREASEICVQNFLSDYYSTPESWSVQKAAQQVLTALNRWLYSRGRSFQNEQKGYICTLSILIIKSRTAHIFHVGDSRIYLYRDGKLDCLTRDHATAISEQHTYLTRAMGLDTRLEVDYRKVTLEPDDAFLLSTDGLHDVLSHKQLLEHFSIHASLETIANNLLDDALKQGSQDNLSCQLLRIDQLGTEEVGDFYQKLGALPFPPFLKPGMVLDGYKIIREIHASNRSQLYIVEDAQTHKRYCMKTPSVNFNDDAAYIERFLMESWIGKRIQNSHVIKVIDTKQTKSFLYYITEYIDGITLSQWIKENPKPSIQTAVYLLDQIGRGLRALHRKEILHQDIKPDNILIDKNGEAKIIDFGSCQAQGVSEIYVPIIRDVALGTASYSAPEYTVKKKASYTADIFSLAVVAYEVITGELPFEGKLEDCKSPQDFFHTRYVPAYHHNPHVPLWIDGALRKALRYDPERRYQEVSEFIYDLQHPNTNFENRDFVPLTQRNPLKLWKALAIGLAITQLITLIYFLS